MKRALALLAPAVLVLGLAACGDDDDDDSPDTTTATADTTSDVTTGGTQAEEDEASGSIPGNADDLMSQLFPNLSSEQIDCLIEQVGDATEALDADQAQAVADACDIDPENFTGSVPDLSDISVPDNFSDIIAQAFPGLDEEQVDCLLDELGPDLDLSNAANLAETCNIDPSDLQPGG